ncbi:uncharacterized protein LOC112341689 isoform X1 [Selaginella moellendorffii]|uniref:uncharacterized protein LOC112341689 isoform X1 n=1 Tax=Selaginella moellendorffii TaxID=88036 RepID=UPI000D1C798C|nr:uncharacterized protein LOC112341689 isoform X1 [Selaginella moellendorffii]|eukprot:XP_024518043.1 uncharacterized protein LOC112341689 isoform X1 [Selaginella moellendorffii]
MLASHQASGLAFSKGTHRPLFLEAPGKWAKLNCAGKQNSRRPVLSTSKDLSETTETKTVGLVVGTDVARTFPESSSSWRMTEQHLVFLGIMASVIMAALCGIILAAIPTLLAIKKAAEAMEKLAKTTREELPGTMAAVRLSGMEISDLTMELSDLGQEITAGVRRSTQAVRAAEDGLRRASSLASAAMWQAQTRAAVPVQTVVQPLVAERARNVRQMIARARMIVKNLVTLGQMSSWLGRHTRKH